LHNDLARLVSIESSLILFILYTIYHEMSIPVMTSH
jgi:hypothetical protein